MTVIELLHYDLREFVALYPFKH